MTSSWNNSYLEDYLKDWLEDKVVKQYEGMPSFLVSDFYWMFVSNSGNKDRTEGAQDDNNSYLEEYLKDWLEDKAVKQYEGMPSFLVSDIWSTGNSSIFKNKEIS
jgi:hypothetical protein